VILRPPKFLAGGLETAYIYLQTVKGWPCLYPLQQLWLVAGDAAEEVGLGVALAQGYVVTLLSSVSAMRHQGLTLPYLLQNTCRANRAAVTLTCTGLRRPKPRCQCTPVSSRPLVRIL
jgi:hypothetical protein